MLNTSCLLARNGAKTPWLSDFQSIHSDDQEIELLKENVSLYQAVANEDNYSIHGQDPKSTFIPLYTKANDIIHDLISLNTGNEHSYELLDQVCLQENAHLNLLMTY